jgi:hypothetical protein
MPPDMNAQPELRKPTQIEQALLERLLEAQFPGRNELAVLLRDVLVKTLDKDGGLELQSRAAGTAPVVQRIPVGAEGKDQDGTVIHMDLHVIAGRPVELEFYREDGATVVLMPSPAAFELIVLPPPPEHGWLSIQWPTKRK